MAIQLPSSSQRINNEKLGAFTDYIINLYGLDAYLNIYGENNSKKALEDVLEITVDEL